MLRKLKTYLGRVVRDVIRKIEDNPWLEPNFARLLILAHRVLAQERGQRGPKVYSLHAPEVECIGKAKPHKPYEFGVKVSVAPTLQRCKGGQFAIHAKALPVNPYDGHTLAKIIPAIEQLIGNEIERLHDDAGYRGHNALPDYKFKVYTSRQKRRLTPQIKREMRRRRTGDRASKERAPDGPQLRLPPLLRRQQCDPRGDRLPPPKIRVLHGRPIRSAIHNPRCT